jgi:hypothetical protein
MQDVASPSRAVEQLIARAGSLSLEEAADLYRAHGARLVTKGPGAMRASLLRARATAVRTGRLLEYDHARHAAATAWRHALPAVQGPWLLVGQAISNAAGALVLRDVLDAEDYQLLAGAWRQAMGFGLTPVGPGVTRQLEATSRH